MINFRQWCIADPADKRPRNIHKKEIGVHDLNELVDYTTAKAWADHYGWVVGFILTEEDPFTCIDLDIKPGLAQEEIVVRRERFNAIIQTMGSYTEWSMSGKGYHIWVMGNIGAGRRRDGVEVYSRERFIICTGNPVEGYCVPIVERQEILDRMVAQMPITNADFNLVELDEEDSDDDIILRAEGAENADKFNLLWEGKWEELGYPSASEADLSLLSMLAFYSKCNEQCRRLFKYSKLGEREKHQRSDMYINRCLRVIRKRQQMEEAQEAATTTMAQNLASQHQSENPPEIEYYEPEVPVLSSAFNLEWPPGVMGYLARYFYQNSSRPVKEIAITSALALMSGVCGKAWNVNGTGLNGYYVMIAQSGVGKEALYSNLSGLLSAMDKHNKKLLHPFIDFTEYVSAPALLKSVFERQCCINTFREFGKFIEELTGRNVNQNTVKIKTTLTKLYSVSGHDSFIGGLGYSKAEESVAGANGISFSLIGETTPHTFFDALDSGMMEDGFLSRFILVSYDGERVPLNINRFDMDDWLVNRLCDIATIAMDFASKRMVINVQADHRATALLAEFDKYCDDRINETRDEFRRQVWNRAHLKVLREASKMAVIDNPAVPVMVKEHVEWAISLMLYNHNLYAAKAAEGDIVSGKRGDENQAMEHFRHRMYAYVKGELPGHKSLKLEFVKQGLIPRSYIFNFVACSRIYLKTGMTLNMSRYRFIEAIITEYLKNGYFSEVSETDQKLRQGYHGKLYKIISLP